MTRVTSGGHVNVQLSIMTKVRGMTRGCLAGWHQQPQQCHGVRPASSPCLLECTRPRAPLIVRPALAAALSQDMEQFGYNDGSARDQARSRVVQL